MLSLTALRAMKKVNQHENETAQTNGTLLSSPGLVVVLDCLKKHGKQTSLKLGERLGLGPKVISARLNRLHNIGQLDRQKITYAGKGGMGYIYAVKDTSEEAKYNIADILLILEEASNG